MEAQNFTFRIIFLENETFWVDYKRFHSIPQLSVI